MISLQTFAGALVYTIGDNEWTDCHRAAAGGFNPRERLTKLREMFFATPDKSLGQVPIAVESQSRAMPDFKTYCRECTRFEKNGVRFISVHVVGSNNGFEAQDPDCGRRVLRRATRRTPRGSKRASPRRENENAKAVVLFMQAEFDQARFPERIDAAPVRLHPRARRHRGRCQVLRQACPGHQWRRAFYRTDAAEKQQGPSRFRTCCV